MTLTPLYCFLLAAMNGLPCEYVIDFTEAAPFKYEMVLTFEARDGSRLEDLMIEWSENTDPKANRDTLVAYFRDSNWAVRAGPGNTLIVVGRSKGDKSPIRSVTLKSDRAIPVQVRWVPLAPEKKK